MFRPRQVSYAVWVKVLGPMSGNFGWILTQAPDYGWSRAITLGDYRLGHVSITTSSYWDSTLGTAPSNEWLHVVGVWSQGEGTVYLNGVQGASTEARNGRGSDLTEARCVNMLSMPCAATSISRQLNLHSTKATTSKQQPRGFLLTHSYGL